MSGFGPGRKARSQRAAPSKQPEAFTRQKLEQLALGYLNRFDVSSQKLTRHLQTRARRLGAPAEVSGWIQELVARYQSSGVLDDERFAKNLASQLAARGKSSRAIAHKLAGRGVASEVTEQTMTTRQREEPGAELDAARAYVRKRRLGPHRSPETRAQFAQKDLASLARQGFSFDIARKALGPGASSDDEF